MKQYILLFTFTCILIISRNNSIASENKVVVIPLSQKSTNQFIESYNVYAHDGSEDSIRIGEKGEVMCFLTSIAINGDTNTCLMARSNNCSIIESVEPPTLLALYAQSCPGASVSCMATCYSL